MFAQFGSRLFYRSIDVRCVDISLFHFKRTKRNLFTTSTEQSQMSMCFGELICSWTLVVWSSNRHRSTFDVNYCFWICFFGMGVRPFADHSAVTENRVNEWGPRDGHICIIKQIDVWIWLWFREWVCWLHVNLERFLFVVHRLRWPRALFCPKLPLATPTTDPMPMK